MPAGINITLVGAFAFGTFIPNGNPPIIFGPLLLLVALAFFAACCGGPREQWRREVGAVGAHGDGGVQDGDERPPAAGHHGRAAQPRQLPQVQLQRQGRRLPAGGGV
ncbi:hypothetical protein EYF80_062578 [Liparis tanakae]|uniref:Uncharacterized protein n=1 Tax=Liparis tanakae TaxID=230148 RepID=A0A4Z2EER9_9TELE|nr:hypothetical protein EYF80_062578 [Liparis tanakae]